MKNFLAPLAEPLGALWTLLLMGTLILLCRRRWRCCAAASVPLAVTFLLGSTPLAESLTRRMEALVRPVSVADLADHDAVVCLGGGWYPSRFDPESLSVGPGGARVIAAIEIVRQHKADSLVLGGSSAPPAASPVNRTLEEWIQRWQLTSAAITNLGICSSTHEEAVHCLGLAEQKRWHRIILVTSALHMPRAMASFSRQGISCTPFPCDYQLYGTARPFGSFSIFPRQARFLWLAAYIHEKLGTAWYRWKGWA